MCIFRVLHKSLFYWLLSPIESLRRNSYIFSSIISIRSYDKTAEIILSLPETFHSYCHSKNCMFSFLNGFLHHILTLMFKMFDIFCVLHSFLPLIQFCLAFSQSICYVEDMSFSKQIRFKSLLLLSQPILINYSFVINLSLFHGRG